MLVLVGHSKSISNATDVANILLRSYVAYPGYILILEYGMLVSYNKGKKNQFKTKIPKLYDITLTDGTKLAYHPSYHFSDEQKNLMQPADLKKYKQARYDYWKKKNGGGTGGSGVDSNQLSEMTSTMVNGFERMSQFQAAPREGHIIQSPREDVETFHRIHRKKPENSFYY